MCALRRRKNLRLNAEGKIIPSALELAVIPGRCEASNPESRDSGSGPSDHPGLTVREPRISMESRRQPHDLTVGDIDTVVRPGLAGPASACPAAHPGPRRAARRPLDERL